MQKELRQLSSIPFILCLFLLLLNDFYLKAAFHNFLTGKLSDICGLFIFPVFWSVLFPRKKLLVFFLTALFFTYWKSPYADSLIQIFSTHVFPIHRVVDLTDLAALLVLPLAWYQMERPLQRNYLNPWLTGGISFFSFCATTMPHIMIGFDQPQYVLFKSATIPMDSSKYDPEVRIYRFDTLTVVSVIGLQIGRDPVKNDDFQKIQVLRDLDVGVLNNLGNYDKYTRVEGLHQLEIKADNYTDHLSFKGSRLNGKIIRKSNTGEVWIEGQYKDGIEDSVWTLREPNSPIVTKKIFENGETVKVERYEANRLVSSSSVLTRSGTIIFKYFQLAFLFLLSVFMVILIVRNYKQIRPEKVAFSTWQKVGLCFALPFCVALINFIIIILIPDHLSLPFQFAMDVFIIYACTFPLFFLIFFGFKIRKSIDMLWYCLLFALLCNIWHETWQVQRLKEGTETVAK